MTKTTRDISFIVLFVLISTFAIWLPHLLQIQSFWGLSFKEGFNTIYRNYDGLEYVIIAKSFYGPQAIAALPQSLPAQYFASHFPGYSILIALISPILGYLKSMLFVSVFFTALSAVAFYFLIKDFKLSSQPLFLSLIFLILPARWLIVHTIGSSEPVFIFFVITAIYLLMKFEQSSKFVYIFFAGLLAATAQLTRPPGILLAVGLGFYVLWHAYKKRSPLYLFKFYPFLLIPLTLLGIFYLYSQTLQDFFAYFHSGDNIHLTFPPFQIFNAGQYWVGDIWLEDIVYIFILGFLGGMMLWRRKLYPMAFFVLTYLTASTLIAHRDISRYLLPISPFILIAFEKVLTSREFKFILPLILLAIYLYAQNFILQNVAPIPNPHLFN